MSAKSDANGAPACARRLVSMGDRRRPAFSFASETSPRVRISGRSWRSMAIGNHDHVRVTTPRVYAAIQDVIEPRLRGHGGGHSIFLRHVRFSARSLGPTSAWECSAITFAHSGAMAGAGAGRHDRGRSRASGLHQLAMYGNSGGWQFWHRWCCSRAFGVTVESGLSAKQERAGFPAAPAPAKNRAVHRHTASVCPGTA